jgi:hypothetical protein
MKVSLKEAYEIAKKALPNHRVEVTVKYGTDHWDKEEKLQWRVQAETINDEYQKVKSESSSDEIFALALSNVVSELRRESAVVVEDVDVDDEKPKAKASVPSPKSGDDEIDSPF